MWNRSFLFVGFRRQCAPGGWYENSRDKETTVEEAAAKNAAFVPRRTAGAEATEDAMKDHEVQPEEVAGLSCLWSRLHAYLTRVRCREMFINVCIK